MEHDVDIGRAIWTTNAIESINARYRLATRARGHVPNEHAELKRLYLMTRSLDPPRWQGALGDQAETRPQRV